MPAAARYTAAAATKYTEADATKYTVVAATTKIAVWLNASYFERTYTVLLFFSRAYKKDRDRRKCKGRRFCLGDRIYSIPCRASYSGLGWFEE